MGTPWAHTWDEVWGATVERHEDALGRRVCGARTLGGNPCTLSSRHRTGRCAFHGGTDAIGAPVGNSNARVHGLYARRLQRCGTHCAMWQHCPFASGEVLALELPERPVCAYELAEYEAALGELAGDETGGCCKGGSVANCGQAGACPSRSDDTDVDDLGLRHLDGLGQDGEGALETILGSQSDPRERPIHSSQHHLALLQVMVSRAAAALSVLSLTDRVTSESDRYQLQTTKVHAALEAFLRLTREHRAVVVQHERALERACARRAKSEPDGYVPSLADLAAPILEQAEGVMEEAIEVEDRRRAYVKTLEALLDQHVGVEWRDGVVAAQSEPDTGSGAETAQVAMHGTTARAP